MKKLLIMTVFMLMVTSQLQAKVYQIPQEYLDSISEKKSERRELDRRIAATLRGLTGRSLQGSLRHTFIL